MNVILSRLLNFIVRLYFVLTNNINTLKFEKWVKFQVFLGLEHSDTVIY